MYNIIEIKHRCYLVYSKTVSVKILPWVEKCVPSKKIFMKRVVLIKNEATYPKNLASGGICVFPAHPRN